MNYNEDGFDWSQKVDYKINEYKKMFTLDSANIKSALVYVVLTAVLGLLMYIIGIGDVYAVNFHSVVNIFSISVATGIVSIIKNLLTDNSGKFLGVTTVIPDKSN